MKYCLCVRSVVDFSIMVLSSGSWPFQQSASFTLPTEVSVLGLLYNIAALLPCLFAFSALKLLVGWWGAGVVICLERVADLHMAQRMPLPLTVFCFSEIQTGFTFLVLAHPGGPGQSAVKRARACVCVLPCVCPEEQ